MLQQQQQAAVIIQLFTEPLLYAYVTSHVLQLLHRDHVRNAKVFLSLLAGTKSLSFKHIMESDTAVSHVSFSTCFVCYKILHPYLLTCMHAHFDCIVAIVCLHFSCYSIPKIQDRTSIVTWSQMQ